ncbi:Nif3-like dinuclear metal center hexameric protein [Pararhodonellum marinum]|uniref:Nif3-like dinuclear metal center hexameric protein n=1 Tax=Pararhodonellum marinum TaxID=2755358 RepID=UPI00188E4A1D|nr:Nif3-like dinuclear metal center hexameric protein [Pararhodonellum marinum]
MVYLIQDIIGFLESYAPKHYQESYDNSGLITGNAKDEVKGVICALDMTEEVVEEAIQMGCNLVIAHHPIVFKGIKQLTGKNYVERTVIKAIKNDIALYAIHTNLDNVQMGVNHKIARQLKLQQPKILAPKKQLLFKLETFIPFNQSEEVLEALFEAGAGKIGEYSGCSFLTKGNGTFIPSEKANPTLGQKGKAEKVSEEKIEVMFPSYLKNKILQTLKKVHPYEEVAYYLFQLENENQEVGSGMVGDLEKGMKGKEFLAYLKKAMNLQVVKHTALLEKPIKRVAVCGGAGIFLLQSAKNSGADVFITADIKYHEFFDADNQIVICDIGHYESEIYTKELLVEILSQNFTNIALYLTKIVTNPITYI